MNTFLRSIKLSNKDTVDDVIDICNRIDSYLSFNFRTKLIYDDVENLLKSAIYVEEAIAMFSGDILITAMIAANPAQRENINAKIELFRTNEYIINVLSKILKTDCGYCHLPAIEEILRTVYDKEIIETLIKQANDKELSTEEEQCDKLIMGVQQLFQLTESMIPFVIDEFMSEMHFSILGNVFLVPNKSEFYSRCSIIVQRICEKLSECTVPTYFIDSMHQTVAYSAAGRSLYWKCLGNIIFARNLRNFFIKYFKTVSPSHEDNQESYRLENICYLVHKALSTESPCRLAYQNALNNAEISPNALAVLQRQVLIFDD